MARTPLRVRATAGLAEPGAGAGVPDRDLRRLAGEDLRRRAPDGQAKAVHAALGVTRDGQREVLGLWIAETAGVEFRLSGRSARKNRGTQDIPIAVVDVLKAIPAAFPNAVVRTGIVHLARPSLTLWSWKKRKVVAADPRRIPSAPSADLAEAERDAVDEKWAGTYALVDPAWRRAWQEGVPLFGFDPAIRKVLYTTHAKKSLNRVILEFEKNS